MWWGQKRTPQKNSETEMHRQMHRADVVPELAGRQSMSLVARSKKLKLSSPRAYNAWWSVQSLVLQTGRLVDQSPSVQCSVVGAVPRTPNWQTGRPVSERIVLDGQCSPQVSKLTNWSTSP